MIKNNTGLAFRIFCVTIFWIIPLYIYSLYTRVPLLIGNTVQGHYVFLFFMTSFCGIQNVRGVISSLFQLVLFSFLLVIFILLFFSKGFSYFWLAVFLFNSLLVYLNYVEMHDNNRIDTDGFNPKKLNIAVIVLTITYFILVRTILVS